MLNKKKLTVILLILYISILSAESKNWQEEGNLFMVKSNYQKHDQEEKGAENFLQSKSKVEEPVDKIEEYPIHISRQHIRVKYFDFCGMPEVEKCSMFITLYSPTVCPFVLYDDFKNTAAEGKLQIGENKIPIPYDRIFLSTDSHAYVLSIFFDGQSKEIKVNFVIKYSCPEFLNFDPKTGEVTPKLKNEWKKELKYTSKIVLDKKVIVRSGLTNIFAAGACLLLKSQIDRFNSKVEKRAVMTSVESSKKLLTNFSIGFTVMGLSSIFKALKKEESKRDIVVEDKEAIEFNKNLGKEFELKKDEWKDEIYATISVIPISKDKTKEEK